MVLNFQNLKKTIKLTDSKGSMNIRHRNTEKIKERYNIMILLKTIE